MASSKDILQPSKPLTHRPSLSNASSISAATATAAAAAATATGPASSAAPASGSARQAHLRASSHSIIGAALNANRVGRRKSVTNPGPTNVAAMAAALMQEAEALPLGSGSGARRNTAAAAVTASAKLGAAVSSANLFSSSLGGLSYQVGMTPAAVAAAAAEAGTAVGARALPSPPASLPTHKFMTADGSAIDDDLNDMSDGEIDPGRPGVSAFEISRIRRASDGQPLVKEGRRNSNRMELRCDKCGKGYKHSSCLSKHLWEHTPEWNLTSKLLISKHQQVQLLEAASVLVAMNNKAAGTDGDGVPTVTTPPDSARDFGSDRNSASPATSGYSDQNDGRSSVDTTPPPLQLDSAMNVDVAKGEAVPTGLSPSPRLPSDYQSFSQRLGALRGANGSGFSQSYQSGLAPGNGPSAGIGSSLGHQRLASHDILRPVSSGRNATGQEDKDLAATMKLLNCDFKSASVGDNSQTLVAASSFHAHSRTQDVPPVPPVPAQYLGQTPVPLGGDTSFISSFPTHAPESFTRGDRHRASVIDTGDVDMEGGDDSLVEDDEDDKQSRARSEDDDDGVFGRMEE